MPSCDTTAEIHQIHMCQRLSQVDFHDDPVFARPDMDTIGPGIRMAQLPLSRLGLDMGEKSFEEVHTKFLEVWRLPCLRGDIKNHQGKPSNTKFRRRLCSLEANQD